MNSSIRYCALAFAAAAPVLGFAAGTITTPEEHVLRGFFDRQSSVIAADKLALEKGSTDDVKKFAQAELDMYQKLGTDMVGIYKEFLLVNTPNPTGEYRPLEEGKSRGVKELTNGQTWSQVGVLQQISRGAAGAAAMAPVARPANCQSTTVPGCGATIAPGIDLNKLSGAEFDKAYLLLVIYGHDAMMRHSTDELLFTDSNPDMVAFAKSAIQTIAKQSSAADGLYRGTGGGRQGGGGRAGGPARGGGAPGAAGTPPAG
jgi:predicted outer membrane protein